MSTGKKSIVKDKENHHGFSYINVPENNKPHSLSTDWKSIKILNIVSFLCSVSMCLILPTVWPYMKEIDVNASENLYGFINGLYAFGNIIFSMLSGWTSNKISDTRPALIIGQFIVLPTAVTYLLLEVFSYLYTYVFIVSQFMLGISVGVSSVYRTFIAMASTEADRSKAIGTSQFAISSGFIIGPLIQAAFAQIHYPGLPLFTGIHLNLYTAPIILAILIAAIGIFLLLFCFDGHMQIRDIPTPIYTKNTTLGTMDEDMFLEEKDFKENEQQNDIPKYDIIAVIVLILVKITSELFLLTLSIVCAPYNMTAFLWTSQISVLINTITIFASGALSIAFSLLYIFLKMDQKIPERKALVLALSIFLGFFVITYPFEIWSERISYQHIHGTLAPANQSLALNPAYRAAIAEAQKNGLEIVGCNPEFEWCQETPVVNVWLFNIVSVIACGVGLPLIQINLDILYSKILGPIKQGTLQGIFVGSGQALNVLGPVMLSQIYTLYGPKFIWIFEIIVCCAATMMFFIFWKRIIPWNERNATTTNGKMWSETYMCNSPAAGLLQPFAYLSLFMSFGVNPLLYAFISQRFREAVRDIASCRTGSSQRKYTRTRTFVSDIP